MKIFFGRININQEPKDQISQAYYFAHKDTSYFGELSNIENFAKESVYVFMIANGRIHLWKANHWGPDGQNLYFKVIKENIDGLTGAWLAAFKYFYLNLDLIIFTIKRPFKKAFFELNVDIAFTEEMLLNDETYQDEDNYRKIELLAQKPTQQSKNIKLYQEQDEWKIAEALFADTTVLSYFRDNTPHIGKGRKRKDNTLQKVKSATLPTAFDTDNLAIWQLYDTFFCDYNAAEKVATSIERSYYKYSPGSNAVRWEHD